MYPAGGRQTLNLKFTLNRLQQVELGLNMEFGLF